MHIYLDNAATTPLDKDVLEAMMPYLTQYFGNPSSIHSHGRDARNAVEKARKTIASLLHTSPAEIFFTSCGTEADNTAIVSGIASLGIKHAITSPIEHHAVLHTLESLQKNGSIELSFVETDRKGNISYEHLESLLHTHPHSFISLMHANNELGNVNDIERISQLAQQYKSIFHSDTVQTMGHFIHDLGKLNIDFIVGSAHKFHGPKGTGFLYINNRNRIRPLIHGGAQERNMRGGTENVSGIVGMAVALEKAYRNMEEDKKYIESLKRRLIDQLKTKIPGVGFNGNCEDFDKSLYTVVNVSTPVHEINEMILFKLDIEKISVSGGSACSSGTDIGSHVLQYLQVDPDKGHIRFSFSKYNTAEEVDHATDVLKKLFEK